MSKSPTALSLKWLRDRGYLAEVVEQYRGGVRKDLFGFADIVAVRLKAIGQPSDILFLQTTTASHVGARFKKIQNLISAIHCLQADCAVHIHGWSKKGARGKRKVWVPNVFQLELCGKKSDPDHQTTMKLVRLHED